MKRLFFLFIAKPLAFFFLGLSIRGKENLPTNGSCVLVANHNSHLDVFVLMSLFSLSKIKKIHPVAARDYFMKTPFLRWFSKTIVGIIPFDRKASKTSNFMDSFEDIKKVLKRGEMVIIFPEGSRGQGEKMSQIKSGIARLAMDIGDIPIIPVFIRGLGRALPKGDPILVPFNVQISIGEDLKERSSRCDFMNHLKTVFRDLQSQTDLGFREN